jgi:hypothetical protein
VPRMMILTPDYNPNVSDSHSTMERGCSFLCPKMILKRVLQLKFG